MIIILIDNGHGITTKGKRSPDGRLLEYAYTRDIARRVGAALKARIPDADVRLLVPEEADISLSQRAARANAICDRVGVKNVLLVSIHCNAAGDGSSWMTARGWEAWTSPGQTRADKLADDLYRAAEKVLPTAGYPSGKVRKDLTDGDADKEASFTILTRTRCPAVLTENLFQDNKEDVDFMLSEAGREALTRLHVEGIISYVESL